MIRDGMGDERELLDALDRLSVGLVRSWRTQGVFPGGGRVPEELAHALATTGSLLGIERDSVKWRYLMPALWAAIATWGGECTPEALKQIRRRALKAANQALRGDSRDRFLSRCEALATDIQGGEEDLATGGNDEHTEATFRLIYETASPGEREIFQHKRENPGATHGETARALDMATGAVKVGWHRLLKRIQGEM